MNEESPEYWDNSPLDGKFVTCSICGEREKLRWVNGMNLALRTHQMCFTCNFWREKLGRPDFIIIAGQCYHAGEEYNGPGFRGFGGARCVIRFFDGRPNLVSTNLWTQGDIPPLWRSQFPDTAEFTEDEESLRRKKQWNELIAGTK